MSDFGYTPAPVRRWRHILVSFAGGWLQCEGCKRRVYPLLGIGGTGGEATINAFVREHRECRKTPPKGVIDAAH